MDNIVEIPQAQIEMAFVATCIEATARRLGTSYREVFDRMERVGMIDGYIYPCYSTLHTESRENIVDDLLACLKNWEEKQNVRSISPTIKIYQIKTVSEAFKLKEEKIEN